MSLVQYLTSMRLSDDERSVQIPSGGKSVIKSRIEWAVTYLVHAGLLTRPRRGYFLITDRGRTVRANPPARLDANYLKQFPEFMAFLTRHKEQETAATTVTNLKVQQEIATENPEEIIGAAHKALEREIKDELMRRIIAKDPAFFEELIVALLSGMGYGNEDALAEAVGKTGDGGIDEIIFQDKLGLDVVYIQAKRHDPNSSIGSPDVQAFVGALAGRTADKGVFVTTGQFSRPAKEYLRNIQHRIITIDGERLLDLMLEYGIGVRVKQKFYLHRIDEDFFIDE